MNPVKRVDLPASKGFLARVHTVHTVQKGDQYKDEIRVHDVDLSSDLPSEKNGVRWIHIPINNLVWANEWFTKCTNAPMDPVVTTMKTRPSFSQKSEAIQAEESIWPEHAKHLEPSCTLSSWRGSTTPSGSSPMEASREGENSCTPKPLLPPLTVYFPYMSWMKYGDYLATKPLHGWPQGAETLARQRDDRVDLQTSRPVVLSPPEPTIVSQAVLDQLKHSEDTQGHLFRPRPPSPKKDTPGVVMTFPELMNASSYWPTTAYPAVISMQDYPRRTLDQFYYPALNDTSARDKDQTISKWTGTSLGWDGKTEATTDSMMIMVDQFWCWIIDQNTILTSFPSGIYSGPLTDVQDLYRSITQSLAGDPKPLKSVEDMYLLLVREVASYMRSQDNRNLVDLVEIYRWVTGKKAAAQTTYFQEFQQGYASGGHDDTVFNDRRDLKLVLEVADIIDELKMIQHLLNTQKDVIASSIEALGIPTGQTLIVKETIMPLIAQLISISNDAEYTCEMLLGLSDLKSKAASLAEARASLAVAQSSVKEAQVATTQGRAVMLFTIITVVFLPLSFFTSYFGQNVEELTGNKDNPSTWQLWRVATPITVVIIVVALLVAYYITRPSSPLWLWKASAETEAPASAQTASSRTSMSSGEREMHPPFGGV